MCFRQGDIVKIVGTEQYGIVAAITDDEAEKGYREIAIKGDYSDFQVRVDLFYDNKKFLPMFSHIHISPTQVEYAKLKDDDSRQGFLEYMKKTLYHKSLWSTTGRDPNRINEVLSKIETVWRQYPDLRLGQLLVNVCCSYDLFMLEDENLMELLEKQIL